MMHQLLPLDCARLDGEGRKGCFNGDTRSPPHKGCRYADNFDRRKHRCWPSQIESSVFWGRLRGGRLASSCAVTLAHRLTTAIPRSGSTVEALWRFWSMSDGLVWLSALALFAVLFTGVLVISSTHLASVCWMCLTSGGTTLGHWARLVISCLSPQGHATSH